MGDHLPPTRPPPCLRARYRNRATTAASTACLDERRGSADARGPDVCRRSIDIALDSKKATWLDIRAILRDKQARGVKCLADWDGLERVGHPSSRSDSTKSWDELAAEMAGEEAR